MQMSNRIFMQDSYTGNRRASPAIHTNFSRGAISPQGVKITECVKLELYNLLEKLRYPEIAQTPFDEFEDTILTGDKRMDLLYWLLQERPGSSSNQNKLKDNALTDKLIKSYSQIGLCSDINVLLGKCQMDKQLQFLTILTIFIKHVHLLNIETQQNKQPPNADDTESAKNDFSIDLHNVSEISKIDSDNTMESLKYLTDDKTPEKYNLHKLSTHVQNCLKEVSAKKLDNFEPTLERFNTEFKKLTSSSQTTTSNKFSDSPSDLYLDVQNVHSTILIIDKTLKNEAKIKDRQIPEISSKTVKPLTASIKDNIVINEQARNMVNI